MRNLNARFYEFRPGLDTLRYLASYGFLTWLGRRAENRRYRLFTEQISNIDRHILSEGLFEKGVIELLEAVITKTGQTGLMIDIGANIGNHSVALSHLFDRIEAVEPHPVLFRILTANALRNNLAKMTCHNFGLANENAAGTLAEPAGNHGIGKVKERSQLSAETFGLTSDEFASEYAIDLKSAHAFVGQFGELLDDAFIKIDVEGMEEEIVTAIRPLLDRYKPLVGFEWFTREQPRLTQVVSSIPGYELWGIHLNDVGSNLVWRAAKLLFTGRTYQLQKIDINRLDTVYPLALLVPCGKLD